MSCTFKILFHLFYGSIFNQFRMIYLAIVWRSLSLLLSLHVWCWNSEATGSSILILDVSELCGVSSVSVSSGLGSDSDNSSMNSAWDAVLLLDVKFWQMEDTVVLIGLISRVIFNILLGGFIDNLFHLESLDGLILTDSSVAVHADNDLCSTLILLTSSVISSLSWHFIK